MKQLFFFILLISLSTASTAHCGKDEKKRAKSPYDSAAMFEYLLNSDAGSGTLANSGTGSGSAGGGSAGGVSITPFVFSPPKACEENEPNPAEENPELYAAIGMLADLLGISDFELDELMENGMSAAIASLLLDLQSVNFFASENGVGSYQDIGLPGLLEVSVSSPLIFSFYSEDAGVLIYYNEEPGTLTIVFANGMLLQWEFYTALISSENIEMATDIHITLGHTSLGQGLWHLGDWVPGQPIMAPDPDGSLQAFLEQMFPDNSDGGLPCTDPLIPCDDIGGD